MTKYESDCLKVLIGKGYGSGLLTHSQTLEEIKEEIDRADARAVSLGYKSEVYTITCEEVYVWYNDDGNFVKRETYENVVEVYHPNKR